MAKLGVLILCCIQNRNWLCSQTVSTEPASQGPRQHPVIALVAQGLKNSEVAEVIGTTEYVVKNHLRIIFDKLGFWNRIELALWYEARRHEGLAYEEPDRILV
jgi:DNA-binding NarL/FixJ family response regulator